MPITIRVGMTGLIDGDRPFCIVSINELNFNTNGKLLGSSICVGIDNKPYTMCISEFKDRVTKVFDTMG